MLRITKGGKNIHTNNKYKNEKKKIILEQKHPIMSITKDGEENLKILELA